MVRDQSYERSIIDLIARVEPCDDVERGHIDDALRWIASGAQLCRITKPATPPTHLVAYFVVVDVDRMRVLLVDHINAGIWLPTGGHVDVGEHPEDTVRREAREELDIDAVFISDAPVFLTVSETVGATAGHTDVSLWYVITLESTSTPWFDRSEFHQVGWFDLDALPRERTDPGLHRFAAKLRTLLRSLRTTEVEPGQ